MEGDVLLFDGGGGVYDFTATPNITGFDMLDLNFSRSQRTIILSDSFVAGANGFGMGGLLITGGGGPYSYKIDGTALTAGHAIVMQGQGWTSQNYTILGGGGNDRIEGDGGSDSLGGGGGNDTIFGSAQADYIAGGS